MALLEKDLIVKTSSLPNSGKGLFTKVFIPKKTLIVEYQGEICKWKDVEDNFDNGYIYYVNRNHVIDAGKSVKFLARYANDAFGLSKIKGTRNNSKYKTKGRQVFIESVEDIHPGEEIFVSYGEEYWNVVKKNITIDNKKKSGK
ncbi:MAG TPA: SET domain-containing protein-lysine N-methyltransferase [Ferruginibacter sp.]|jgi:SET domain-containing protein|nr:SET domain-containing protein-lysine N-methyltransferase [Ferruginibacter sp.]